jgi:phytoene desaturase
VDDRVPGLVFVGSGTQPGVGIPMVLVSGQLAAQRVVEMEGEME